MSEETMIQVLGGNVRPIMERMMDECQLSGMAVAAVRSGQPVETVVLGTDARGQPLAEDSLFPVASVTKLATALAVLRLVDRHILALDETFSRYVPEAIAAQRSLTLRQLLSHTSGLPVHYPEDAARDDATFNWQARAEACLQVVPDMPPGTRVAYSNVGYGLLAIAVEHVTNQPYRDTIDELVFRPLGMEAYFGRAPGRPTVAIADPYDAHVGTPLEFWNTPFFHSLGEPWAGLVTTQAGMLTLINAFRGVPSGFLTPEIVAEATRNQTGELGGGVIGWLEWPRCPWGLGPLLRGENTPHSVPAEASPQSFGHLGLSGALVWMDPAVDVAWAINGTRTFHDGWDGKALPAISAAILANARRQ